MKNPKKAYFVDLLNHTFRYKISFFPFFASNQLLSLMHKLVKDVGDDEWGECQVLLSNLLP